VFHGTLITPELAAWHALAHNLGSFMPTLALAEAVKQWSLASLTTTPNAILWNFAVR